MARRLGEVELLLLFALLEVEDRPYGARLRQCVERRTGRELSPGGVYTTLERLEELGYVSSRVGEATPARGGKRRKYYRLESTGAAALRATYDTMRDMSAGLEQKLLARSGGAES